MAKRKKTVRQMPERERNNNTTKIVTIKNTPNKCKLQMARWVGFCDVMRGYAPRKEYETWFWQVQENYERGRHEAVIIKTAFKSMTWPRTSTLWSAVRRRFGNKALDHLVPVRDFFIS